MYGRDRIQIWLENGSFLSIGINAYGDELDIELLGPSPPIEKRNGICGRNRRQRRLKTGD
jgi:hypothetical protein